MMLTVLVWVLGACWGEPTLPPAKRAIRTHDGRMVRAPGVSGYLARPTKTFEDPPTTHAAGVLLLVDAIDPASRKQADQLAIAGEIALAVPPDVELDPARAYLSAIPVVTHIRVECARADCP